MGDRLGDQHQIARLSSPAHQPRGHKLYPAEASDRLEVACGRQLTDMTSVSSRGVPLPRIISTFAEYRHWRSTLPLKRIKLAQAPSATTSNGTNGTNGTKSIGTSTEHDGTVLVAPSIGFVPTMGALHAGHLALAKRARKESDLVVLSIFVNPAQFAPSEDLDKYPRTLDKDLEAIVATAEPVMPYTNGTASHAANGYSTNSHSNGTTDGANAQPELRSAVDVILLPSARELYPTGITQDVSAQRGAFIAVHGLSHQLEGLVRPHFFRGVSTVVHKLLAIVRPTTLYLGQKDVQQCVVVRRMMTDLLWHLDTNLVVGETVREQDGLAMSSRNVYLSQRDRKTAPRLYRALQAARQAYLAGEVRDAEEVKNICRRHLAPSSANGAGQRESSITAAEIAGNSSATSTDGNSSIRQNGDVEEDLEIEYVSVADSVDLAEWVGDLPPPSTTTTSSSRTSSSTVGNATDARPDSGITPANDTVPTTTSSSSATTTARGEDGALDKQAVSDLQRHSKIAILSAAIRLGSTRILDNVLLDGSIDDLGLSTTTAELDGVVGTLPRS